MIVGDPLQLQPVVTLPWEGQRALLRDFGVGEQWAPSRTSVQQVADRLAEHGTALPGPASDEPVGSARRCECTGDVTDPCSTSATRSPMTA